MISFEHRERVHAPVEDAFEFGLDPDNWLRHFSDMEEYEVVDDTVDEMVVRVPYRVLWIPMEFEIVLRVEEPYRHIAVDFESGWMAGDAHYYYTDVEEGTLIESEGSYRFGDSAITRLLEPVIKLALHRKIRQASREEKRLIEAEAADR